MAKLVILQGGDAKNYELTGEEAVMGRHPECSIQLESNMVSRRHARVFKNGNVYLIEDLGSGNGTVVNGEKIEGALELKNEDRIKLGSFLLWF